MGVLEIIGAILLIISCILIIVLVLMQDSSKGMSQSLTGTSGDNYFQKNSGRTKEARLKNMTKYATIVVFVITILVNVIANFGGKGESDDSNTIQIDGSDLISTVQTETTEQPETEPVVETEAPAAN